MSITIRDVAKHAGVSVATVSRVINDSQKEKVSPGTRKRVHQVINRLGYRPNLTARSLSKKITSHVGLVVPVSAYLFSNSYYAGLMQGIMSELSQFRYSLTLYDIHNLKDDLSIPLQEGQVDGLLVTAPALGLIKNHTSFNRQVVLLNASYPDLPFSSVDCDNMGGAREATDHLLKLGHEIVACINGPLDNPNAQERAQGYRSALELHGIPFSERLVGNGGFVYHQGLEAARALLAADPRPTAVFCANDTMAVACLEAAREQKLSVPQDVSVVGFDDSDLASVVQPSLTTVRQQVQEIGRTGARLLLEQLGDHDFAPQNLRLPVKIVVRNSSSAVTAPIGKEPSA